MWPNCAARVKPNISPRQFAVCTPPAPTICLLLVVVGAAGPLVGGAASQSQQATSPGAIGAPRQQQLTHTDTYLESMEDLDHLAYLSLRNYNITDEALLQSSWLMGLGNALGSHKQHQKPGSPSDLKSRLALMLESFISHLRNGHLRRLSLEELESIVSGANLTDSYAALRSQHPASDTVASAADQSSNESTLSSAKLVDQQDHEAKNRCQHLVTLYQFELLERQRGLQTSQQPPEGSQQQQPIVNERQAQVGDDKSTGRNQSSPSFADPIEQQAQKVDTSRLFRLCRLAIGCHSADELVNLIAKPWKTRPDSVAPISGQQPKARRSLAPAAPAPASNDNLERDSSSSSSSLSSGQTGGVEPEDRSRRKSLRDSLSLSLAKLCPLILFQLHEDDGMCSVRRDDRPPMITVWAFATLFVTIVSFCSLIGLSLTPLLGQQPSAADSSAVSDSSEPIGAEPGRLKGVLRPASGTRSPTIHNGAHNQSLNQQHKASLTLFEGLAVGSLVGSALFSLIPQAFELQERESNQSFLLKAFIIFSGIYLFFCSERVMRIILDTRQKRKKKRLTHRSSTTAAIEPEHHHLMPSSFDQFTSSSRQHSQASKRANQQADGTRTVSRNQRQTRELVGQQRQIIKIKNSDRKIKGPGSLDQGLKLAGFTQTNSANQCPEAHHSRALAASRKPHSDKTGTEVASLSNSANWQQQMPTTAPLAKSRGGSGHKRTTTPRSVASCRRARSAKGRQQSSRRLKRQHQSKSNKLQPQQSRRQPMVESDHDYYHVRRCSTSSSSSSATSSSSSSFAAISAARTGFIQTTTKNGTLQADDSKVDYSSSSCFSSSLGQSFYGGTRQRVGFSSATVNLSDSDNDNQARAVNKQMSEFFRRIDHASHQGQAHGPHADRLAIPHRTTFQLETPPPPSQPPTNSGELSLMVKPPVQLINPVSTGERVQKQDISTVAWMIILGDGLHNFIDGISIGAAFSESILSGVSISVAVICEEFPHELGDFAVLVSSGMTIRQALGYNFLSACTCYFGMAIGIILGDVTDGASYISALAAGVFLYIALVDMMGELSAALEATSRDSIARTLKLLLLQNVGIFIGISIIFVLSFIDF